MPSIGNLIIKGVVVSPPVGEMVMVNGTMRLGVSIRVKCTDENISKEGDEEIEWHYTEFDKDVDLESYITKYPVGALCEFYGTERKRRGRPYFEGDPNCESDWRFICEHMTLMEEKEPEFNGDYFYYVIVRNRPGVSVIGWACPYCDEKGNKLWTGGYNNTCSNDRIIAWIPKLTGRSKSILSPKEWRKIHDTSDQGPLVLDLEYYVTFGRGDCSDGVPFTIELTDEETALWKAAKEAGISFNEYPPLQKTVDRIYEEAQGMAEADFDESELYEDDTPEEERGFQDGWSVEVTGWPQA